MFRVDSSDRGDTYLLIALTKNTKTVVYSVS